MAAGRDATLTIVVTRHAQPSGEICRSALHRALEMCIRAVIQTFNQSAVAKKDGAGVHLSRVGDVRTPMKSVYSEKYKWRDGPNIVVLRSVSPRKACDAG